MTEKEEILHALKKVIRQTRKNTFKNHVKTWIEGNGKRFYGNIENNKVEIWRFSEGAKGMHPVIQIELIGDDHPKIKIKTSLNPLGKLISLFGGLLMSLILYLVVPKDLTDSFLPTIIIVPITLLVPALILVFAYRYETKSHIDQIKDIIEH